MKKIIIILISIFFYTCTQQNGKVKKETIETIDLESIFDSKSEGKSLSEFSETIEYIPLETNDSFLLDDIQKVAIYNNEIFVHDYQKLFKFSADGKYLCRFGEKGRGPKQYRNLGNFFFRNDSLFIRESNRLFVYNVKNGEFLTIIKFDNKYRRTHVNITQKHIISFNHVTNWVEYYNTNGELLDSAEYSHDKREILDRTAIAYSYYDILFGTKSSLKLTSFCNDTIFEIDDSYELNPKYVVNLGEYKLPDKLRVEPAQWDYFYNNSTGYFRKVSTETSDYLILQLGAWNQEQKKLPFPLYPDKKSGIKGLAFYSKNNKSVSLISKDDENYPCFYPNYTDGENSLLGFVNAIDAITFFEENKNKINFCEPFRQCINNLKENDNPVLMLAKLKE